MSSAEKVSYQEASHINGAAVHESWAERTAQSAYQTLKEVAGNPYVEGAAALVAIGVGGKIYSKFRPLAAEAESITATVLEDSTFSVKNSEDLTILRRPATKASPVEEFSFQMPPREQPVYHDPFAAERQSRPVLAAAPETDSKSYRPLVLTHRGKELELIIPQIGMPIIRQKAGA